MALQQLLARDAKVYTVFTVFQRTRISLILRREVVMSMNGVLRLLLTLAQHGTIVARPPLRLQQVLLEQVLQLGVHFDCIGVVKRLDHVALLIIFVSDVDARVLLRLEEVLSEHALALGHNSCLHTEQVRDVIVLSLVWNR